MRDAGNRDDTGRREAARSILIEECEADMVFVDLVLLCHFEMGEWEVSS